MDKEKLKEIKLSKKAKYGFASMFLVATLSIGVASLASRDEVDEVVNNQQVTVIPPSVEEDDPIVIIEDEKLAKPYSVDATIKTYYFDAKDTSKNQENALVYYNGMYTPSYAIDYFFNNNVFDVLSSFSGVVVEKKVDPLYGVTLYIKSDDNPNLLAAYASLSNVSVNVGDKVSQGQIIAKSGSNTINSNMGNHLNFSLIKDNKTIDPLDYYSKTVKDI